MSKMYKLVLIWYLVFWCGDVFSQASATLPKVILPSPAAQNFMRYGEIPVDFSTGVPNISVPLYTITSRKLSLPIGISYHASGIKVNDKPSSIGLGWVLNAGGLIAVTMLGNAMDGATRPTYTTIAPFVAEREALKNDLDLFRTFGSRTEYELRVTDWQSDRYFYQLPNGQSGVFRYDYTTGQVIKIPYSPIKIEKSITHFPALGFPDVITAFEITDDTGITYSYNLRETWDGSVPNWDLTRIMSADKTDTIRLVYKANMNAYTNMSTTSTLDYGDFISYDPNTSAILYTPMSVFNNAVSAPPRSAERLLDSIISSNTIVKFYSSADRQDQGLASIAPHRITQLKIYDRYSKQQIKSFSFDQSYFGSQPTNNLRLKLNGISVSGSDATVVEKYGFEYESQELPPYPENIPGSPYKFAEDYWGYYNGKPGNSLIPFQFVPESFMGIKSGHTAQMYPGSTGDREPDHSYAKACMIKEIQYPTGGKTVFDFEPNEAFARVNANGNIVTGNVGGFRIRQITNLGSSNEIVERKTYEYDINSAKTRVIKSDLYSYQQRMFEEKYHVIRQTVTSSPLLPLTCENGPPVFYGKVTEYNGYTTNPNTGNATDANTGKTIYTFLTPPAEFHAPFAVPATGTSWDPLFHFFEGMRYQDAMELDRGNYNSRLESKTNYKNVNGLYTKVDSTVNTYGSFLPEKYYSGIQVVQATTYSGSPWDDYHWCASIPGYSCYDDTYQYPFYLYPIELNSTQEVSVPVETRTYNFSPDGLKALVDSITYDYGSLASYTYGQKAHLQPTQQVLVNSRGDAIKAESKYPVDFSSAVIGGSSNVYDQMLSHNIITPIIQQRKLKNNIFLESNTTNYQQWSADGFLPQSTQWLQAGMASPDTRIVFRKYDSYGNITELQKANDVVHVYLWGYKGTRPVAEVVGSDYVTVSGLVNMNMLKNASSYSDQQLRTELNKIRTGLAANSKPFSVTTYTYSPLVGITSQTNPSGQTIYYEYDAFNRLALIRDTNGDIVKTYSYHYQDK
jgi:YD repeat-containing protein